MPTKKNVLLTVTALLVGSLFILPQGAVAGASSFGGAQIEASVVSSKAKLTKIERYRIKAEIAELQAEFARLEYKDAKRRAVEFSVRAAVIVSLVLLPNPIGLAAAQLATFNIATKLGTITKVLNLVAFTHE